VQLPAARVVTGYQAAKSIRSATISLSDNPTPTPGSDAGSFGCGCGPTFVDRPEFIAEALKGWIGAVGANEPVPGRLRSESELWLQAGLAWDLVNDFWNERIVRFDAERQLAMLERLGFDDPDWRTMGLGLTAGLAAFFVALSVYMGWKFRRPQRDWPARLHQETARRLARRGLVAGRAEGPVDFLDRARARCPDLASQLAEIRDLYVALRYGPRPDDASLRRLHTP
jgi:hypothetical protein